MHISHKGVLCAAYHVCRSGIRVNWNNPHLKIKLNITSPQIWTARLSETSDAQRHTFFFNGESGDDTDLSLRSASLSHVDLPHTLHVGRLTNFRANLANWSLRLVSSPYVFSRFRNITKLRISQAPPIQHRTGLFWESPKRMLAIGCHRNQRHEAIDQVQSTFHVTACRPGWRR